MVTHIHVTVGHVKFTIAARCIFVKTNNTCKVAAHIEAGAVYRLPGIYVAQIVTQDEVRVFADIICIGVGVPAVAVAVPPVEYAAALFNINGRCYSGNQLDRFHNRVNDIGGVTRLEHCSLCSFSQAAEIRFGGWVADAKAGYNREYSFRCWLLCRCFNNIPGLVPGERFRVVGFGIAYKNDYSANIITGAPGSRPLCVGVCATEVGIQHIRYQLVVDTMHQRRKDRFGPIPTAAQRY